MLGWLRARWTAQGLAHWGMELLVVVLGILIAFQLQSWAESRRDAKQQRELLERLTEEAGETVGSLRMERDIFQEFVDTQMAALDRWVNGGTCPTNADWSAFDKAGYYPALQIPSAAYDEMIGSGGIARLPTPAVRSAVNRFHASLVRYERQQDYFRQGALAEDAKTAAALGAVVTFDREERDIGLTNYDRAACRNPLVKKSIASQVRSFGIMQRYRNALTSQAIVMCVRIAEALGARCRPTDGTPLTDKDIADAFEMVEEMGRRR